MSFQYSYVICEDFSNFSNQCSKMSLANNHTLFMGDQFLNKNHLNLDIKPFTKTTVL